MSRMVCPALFFITWLGIVFLSSPMAVKADDESEVEDEIPFTYDPNSKKGPDNWGNLRPEWETCKNGKLQSPIDLNEDRVMVLPALGRLQITHKQAPAIIRNRGHDIMVAWEDDAGGIMINGTEYKLQQCHWHTPSEHTLNGKRFEMELHMVHKNSRGQTAVISIMYKSGRPDPFLATLLQSIRDVDREGKSVGVVDPRKIKFGNGKYFRYIGSFTVPPCTEGVIWTILKKVRRVSCEQIGVLKSAVHDGFERNARPTQSSDGRSVYMYRPLTQ
ncbi:hypothetical protein OROGR_006633 [Orobanche gracilis]